MSLQLQPNLAEPGQRYFRDFTPGDDFYEALIEAFSSEAAIKRPNTVEEVAAVAVLLASDAGRNITGCMFPVDGGTMPY